jgi:crossover junction endodeoxyribonuclease RuvC
VRSKGTIRTSGALKVSSPLPPHPSPDARTRISLPLTPLLSPDSRTRILGIDPGLRITGFGIIDKNGSRLTYVASGRIRTSDTALDRRLKAILDGLAEVIAEHRPAQVTIEKVFVNVNPSSTLLLGQARGTAICAAVMHGLPVAEYTALQVKQAVVGNGHAQKRQVQEMVRRLLRLVGEPGADAADALACAICHAHGGQGLGRLATAGFRMKRGRLV